MTSRRGFDPASGAGLERRPRSSAQGPKPGGKGRRGKTELATKSRAASSSTTLVNTLKKGETPAEAIADMAVAGLVSNACAAARFSKSPLGDVDITGCLAKLEAVVDRVQRGDLRETEALLTAQAVTLNTMFTHLANMAANTEYVDKLDRYMRLALKAQGQCRATVETLAAMKNPPAVFARQANVAHGPQQVNNGVTPPLAKPTRAAKQKNRTNRTIGDS